MGQRSARRLLSCCAMMVAALIGICGCRSTSGLPPMLGASAAGASSQAIASRTNAKSADDVAWKKSGSPPSTALAQDQWGTSARPGEPIRPAGFQNEPLPKVVIPPIPEVMIKEHAVTPAPRTTPAKPASLGRGGKHGIAPAMPMAQPAPSAPTERALVHLPTYIIRPPDVLLIESQKGLLTQPIRGQHLVRPDGTVGMGIYGPVPVGGRTIQQAREAIARVIHNRLDKEKVTYEDVLDGLNVDILAYNSTVYYIITDGAGLGEAVYRFPVTGSETVLDAISHINGLPVVSSPKRIWVARRNYGPLVQENVLPVDWLSITRGGSMATNWQIMPGDRIFVQADPVRRFNNNLGKYLEPIERLFGGALLGGQAVNVIKHGTTTVIR